MHIGTEKTGSTSVQTFFAQNRAALLAHGWLYPETPGLLAHHSLLAYGLDDGRNDNARRIAGVGKRISLDAFRRQVIRSLDAEIAASGASTLVLSNERLATRLRLPAGVARLKALCDRLARTTKVIVYLRNQADFFASRHTNVIWEGGTRDLDFPGPLPIADYALLLDRWSDVFGKQNLVVRRFEPGDFPAGDLIADFAQVTGLDTRGLQMPARANPSLDAESLAFLRTLNCRLPYDPAGRVQSFRNRIVRVLQRRRGGTRFTIPHQLATRIEDAYRDSNERVSTDYFDCRYRPLFSPPVLVSDTPVPHRIGAIAAIRMCGLIATGLLRDGFIWGARRLLRRDGSPAFR
ncbi:MAG TPA: hypothetical protein VKR31_02860 [Rhizomicrobium sp.]|nr:hypothetical protein [Rhizomicrobium sp.]